LYSVVYNIGAGQQDLGLHALKKHRYTSTTFSCRCINTHNPKRRAKIILGDRREEEARVWNINMLKESEWMEESSNTRESSPGGGNSAPHHFLSKFWPQLSLPK